jgi:hypothetical protein
VPVPKRTGSSRPASCEKSSRRKCTVIGNPLADDADDFGDRLCNIETTTGARSNGVFRNGYRSRCSRVSVSQMQTPRTDRVCRKCRTSRAVALQPREMREKRQVNHTDALQDAVRRFGTDLAPRALRELCAGYWRASGG